MKTVDEALDDLGIPRDGPRTTTARERLAADKLDGGDFGAVLGDPELTKLRLQPRSPETDERIRERSREVVLAQDVGDLASVLGSPASRADAAVARSEDVDPALAKEMAGIPDDDLLGLRGILVRDGLESGRVFKALEAERAKRPALAGLSFAVFEVPVPEPRPITEAMVDRWTVAWEAKRGFLLGPKGESPMDAVLRLGHGPNVVPDANLLGRVLYRAGRPGFPPSTVLVRVTVDGPYAADVSSTEEVLAQHEAFFDVAFRQGSRLVAECGTVVTPNGSVTPFVSEKRKTPSDG